MWSVGHSRDRSIEDVIHSIASIETTNRTNVTRRHPTRVRSFVRSFGESFVRSFVERVVVLARTRVIDRSIDRSIDWNHPSSGGNIQIQILNLESRFGDRDIIRAHARALGDSSNITRDIVR